MMQYNGMYLYIGAVFLGAIIYAVIYYRNYKKKLDTFTAANPDKVFISFHGGERTPGAFVHGVVSQAMENEFSHKGIFSVNPGQVELTVERISMSYNPIMKKTTYTFHGKENRSFSTEAGKKYILKYHKKKDFYLKEKTSMWSF
jgi:hypothetical protein